MSYVRFVPGFTRHPKRLKSGPVSSWLWACSVDFCLEHLTDGFLLRAAVPTLCANIRGSALTRAVENLLAVGSWESVDGGYLVHDYLRHNDSKQQVEIDREQGRERYRRWLAKRRANAVANALDQRVANAVPNAVANVTHGRSDGRMLEPTTSKGDSRHTKPTKLEKDLRASLEAIKSRHPELEKPDVAEPHDPDAD